MRGNSRRILTFLAYGLTATLLSGCMGPFQWWAQTNHKAKDLYLLRHRHTVLEQKYLELEKKYLDLEHRYTSILTERQAKKARVINENKTGHPDGRHLANIDYKIPSHMDMKEKYDLATQHFQHKRFAEAYVLFEHVLWSPEGAAHQSPDAFYHAGITSFRIKNFSRAKEYFEAADAHSHSLRDQDLIRRTQLWLKVLNHYGMQGRGLAVENAPRAHEQYRTVH